jgi:branched-chain amino acid transport system ATP-binding protein
LTGFLHATSGNAKFNNIDITFLKPHEVAVVGMSRTFQNIRLFNNMTILENVLVGRHCMIKSNFVDSIIRSKKEKEDELKALDFSMDLLSRFGLHERWNMAAGSLPYGEQRLLEIARALAMEPKMILLDEPAAGMNSGETEQLMRAIQEIKQMGITPVLIEHDMKVIMGICSRIIVLDYGCLIAEGTPDLVRNDARVIEAYLGREADMSA